MRRSLPLLTADDTKILGKITEKRKEKAVPSTQFTTRKFKTHNSAWTPMVNKATNEQVLNNYTTMNTVSQVSMPDN